MANQHDYINYFNVDDIATKKTRKAIDFMEKEYRFKIKADKENHKIVDEAFKMFFQDLKGLETLKILNIDYYKWEKEQK